MEKDNIFKAEKNVIYDQDNNIVRELSDDEIQNIESVKDTVESLEYNFNLSAEKKCDNIDIPAPLFARRNGPTIVYSEEQLEAVKAIDKVKDLSEEDIDEMSDDEINNLVEALSGSRSEDAKKLEELPYNNSILKVPSKEYMEKLQASKNELEDKAFQGTIKTDPLTGQKEVSLTPEEQRDIDITIDKIMDQNIHEMDDDKLTNGITSLLGNDISNHEILEVVAYVKDVTSNTIDKKEAYHKAPKFIKAIIDAGNENNVPLSAKEINDLTLSIVDMIKNEIETDMSFIELDDAIKNQLNVPDMMTMYLDHIQNIMEVEILKQADEIEEESPDKAETMRGMHLAFIDAYKYTSLKKKIKNKKKIINKELTKDLKDYDRLCKKFNAMYKPSKFVMTDIRTLVFILDRHLSKAIDINSIKKFIILMIKIFRNKDINNLVDHTQMYYTTKLIEALDYTDSDECKLSDTIKANIEDVIFMIEE